jgi:spermidine/putrescine transport system ATP-binding protein
VAQRLAVDLQNVTKQFGSIKAVNDLSLGIRDGEFFSLLGPSGCGKTTTLRMIAGFEQPSEGEIYIHGQPVAGIPPYKRPVNTVFQSYALFPHMSVAENVAFGLEMKKVAKAEIAERVVEALQLVQLPQMSDRRPRQLSGGQQQRVALARALVNKPEVLLLDEPLGALDLKLRKAMQLELKQIQSEVGITFIYVTHDQEEALTMSDRIAVMSDGLVQQVGSPRDIYEHPANRFVADFIGETNFIDGTVVGIDELTTLAVGNARVQGTADGRSLRQGQKATLAVRPEKISLYAPNEAPSGNGKSQVSLIGKVQEAIYIGTDTRYHIHLADEASIFVRVQNLGARYDRTFQVGDRVAVQWNAENAQVLTE